MGEHFRLEQPDGVAEAGRRWRGGCDVAITEGEVDFSAVQFVQYSF
jgi:hypothetical protein